MAPSGQWTKEGTWALIHEFRKKDNFAVLYGKDSTDENTVGDTKAKIYRGIALTLDPEGFRANANKSTNRIKRKITSLESTFKLHAKRLKKTGEGVEEMHVIGKDGPDHDTDPKAKTIWDQITLEWEYFPELYKIWSTRANLIPICATTGVGPRGMQTILIQGSQEPSTQHLPPSLSSLLSSQATNIPPGLSRTISDSQIDPQLRDESSMSRAPSDVPRLSDHATTSVSVGDKENVSPSSGQRRPKPSSFLSGPSKPPPVVPRKRSAEEDLVDIQRDMMTSFNRRAEDAHSFKKRKIIAQERNALLEERKQLTAEFRLGVYTLEEYKKLVEDIKTKSSMLETSLSSDSSSAPQPLPEGSQEGSQEWDQRRLDADESGDEI